MLALLPLAAPPALSAHARTSRPSGCPAVSEPRRLIAAGGQAELFFARGRYGYTVVKGCAFSSGRVFTLKVCGGESTHATCARTVRLAGVFVAFEAGEWFVEVRDLRTGHVLHRVPTGSPVRPSSEHVGVGVVVSLVLKSDGSAAWIADDFGRTTSLTLPSEVPYFDVGAVDSSATRLLASGSDIDPSSLALSARATNIGYGGIEQEGATVFWSQASKPFSSSLS